MSGLPWDKGQFEYLLKLKKYQIKEAVEKLNAKYPHNPKTIDACTGKLRREKKLLIKDWFVPTTLDNPTDVPDSLDGDTKSILKILKRKPVGIEELSNKTGMLPKKLRQLLKKIGDEKYNLIENTENISLAKSLSVGGDVQRLDPAMWKGDKIRIGFTADNHLGSTYERLDLLNLLYDIFADEGISTVYQGGNWIEGESRFNTPYIHKHGMSDQIDYCVQEWPYREGVETHYVAGEDHEGWYVKREGVNIGEYLQMRREESGKNDMKYIGFIEADINLNENGDAKQSWLRVVHTGGGSAYAISYTPQKLVESYQGGEKPRVLMIGHLHKLGCFEPRGVITVLMGSTKEQDPWMRKLKISSELGAGILELRRAPDGTINRYKYEPITVFDKGFYIGNDKYWKK